MARHVFVDTSIFEELDFKWDDRLLEALHEHVQEGRAVLHLTTITDGEIRRRIRVWREQAQATYAKLPAQVRKGVTKVALPIPEEIEAQYDAFVRSAKVVVHDARRIDAEDLVRRYLQRQPPFSSAKKDEFPDAIAIMILERLASSCGAPVHVVSGDGDWKAACDRSGVLAYFRKLGELLAVLERDRVTQKDRVFADAAAEHAEGALWLALEELREQVEGETFYIIDADPDSEVSGPYVEDVQVYGPNVLHADRQARTATVALEAELIILAEANVGDEDSSYRDSETGDIHYRWRDRGTIKFERSTRIVAELVLSDGEWTAESVETDPLDQQVEDFTWVYLEQRLNEDDASE